MIWPFDMICHDPMSLLLVGEASKKRKAQGEGKAKSKARAKAKVKAVACAPVQAVKAEHENGDEGEWHDDDGECEHDSQWGED